MALRKPTLDEARLLSYLLENSRTAVLCDVSELLVEALPDGGMGSLKLLPKGVYDKARLFGCVLAACQFIDADDVEVIASLYADEEGDPFELDIWKVDYSPVIEISGEFQLLDEEPRQH